MGTSRDDQNIVDTKSKADAANLDKMQQIVALTRNLLVRINVFSECNKNTRTILKERPSWQAPDHDCPTSRWRGPHLEVGATSQKTTNAAVHDLYAHSVHRPALGGRCRLVDGVFSNLPAPM
jgi:hypothetical protein